MLTESQDGFENLDFASASETGLTRAHWVSFADSLIADALDRTVEGSPWNTEFPGLASVNGVSADRLEATARLMILAAYRARATESPMAPGVANQLLGKLELGAQAMHDRHQDRWPDPLPRTQAFVDAASIALAFLISPSEFWEPLSPRAKIAYVTWLSKATNDVRPSNNWVLFSSAVGAFMERHANGHAAKRARDAIRRGEEASDRWYRGGGVFTDGPGSRFDYYNAWGFHYYLPLIAHLRDDQARIRICADRLAKFTPTLLQMFDRSGAPVFFGRSMIYRFGSLAPLWISQLIGAEGTDPGAARLTSSRVLKFFVAEGAAKHGYLSLSWGGDELEIAQDYSSGGSPLWASKAFVGLMLSADDAAWTAAETVPAAAVPHFQAPGFSISRDDKVGTAVLANLGLEREPIWRRTDGSADPLYSRLAYSSCTRPVTDAAGADNSVELVPAPGPVTTIGFNGSSEPGGGHATMGYHRVRPRLRPPAQFLADRLRRWQAVWVPSIRGSDVAVGIWTVHDVQIRAFSPLGRSGAKLLSATTWPIRLGRVEPNESGAEIQIVGPHAAAQTAILAGFERLSSTGGENPFSRCQGSIPSAGGQVFVLATRLSRTRMEEPLLTGITAVADEDGSTEIHFSTGEVVRPGATFNGRSA